MEQRIDLSDVIDFTISDQSPITSKNQKNSELFVLTIEIGNDKKEKLIIHSNDDPSTIAKKFAKKNCLNETVEKSLTKLIKSNKELIENRAISTSPDMIKLEELLSTPTKSPQNETDLKNIINKEHTPQIDKNSREIAKRLNNQDVYTRLYKRNKKTPLQSPSPETEQKTRPSSINHGEWLYANGIRKKEELKKSAEEIKTRDEDKISENPFKPKVNPASTLMVRRSFERTEDLLIDKAKDYEQKLKDLKEVLIKEELKECSFTPKIIETPRTKSRIVEKDYLYKDAEIRRARSSINSEKSITSLNSPRTTNKTTPSNSNEVFSRLYNTKFAFQTKMEHLRHNSDVLVDKSTGQDFFHPQILSKDREDLDIPIWEHLYSQKDKQASIIEKTNELNDEFWKATAMTPKSSENSNVIYEIFKEKQYEKLFNILDSDKDGLISGSNIYKDSLDPKTAQSLSAFFNDLEINKEILDFQKFIVKLEHFMKAMTVEEKSYILKRDSKIYQNNTERKSLVCSGSERIIRKNEKARPQDLYERLMSASKLKEDKIKKMKEMKINGEMSMCTFKPVFISKSTK
ncbi:unnamed protein product [Blepharisma stoltei]|uniref:EF-hand domain-containing protein n=1 Tax=Blepharisma stoltei TaxID=1481888 RepID=A0AAU9INY8_9CILI|nr:unnamed protein product [Blepharisma stoltei]